MPTKIPIVLASASPRRQELLKNAGIEFVVRPADIPEIPFSGERPRAFAERMALEKARAARQQNDGIILAADGIILAADGVILAADTVVAVENEILGKPEDAADAARMLRLLSNRTHEVITGVCLLGASFQFEDVRSETTAVHFNSMSDSDIAGYIATGEPMDKAGAYAIQGGASQWIRKIEGDYSNVVGLPMKLVSRMLREHGVC